MDIVRGAFHFKRCRLMLMPSRRAEWASLPCAGRPAPNAPTSKSVLMHAVRAERASRAIKRRPAPSALCFVIPVLVNAARAKRASRPVPRRPAMSAFAHCLLLSCVAAGHRAQAILHSNTPFPSEKSFTSPQFILPPWHLFPVRVGNKGKCLPAASLRGDWQP